MHRGVNPGTGRSRLSTTALFLLSAVLPTAVIGQSLELKRVERSQTRLQERAQNLSSRLFLPFFADSDSGVVSLYAIRNTTGSPVTLSTLFLLADGQIFESETVLGAKRSLTVNVRDLGLPEDADVGAVVGMADFAVVDPNTHQPIGTRALVGDSFFVDPINNFATGDPLPETGDFCNRINTRFADGGVFDGTTFTLGVPDFDPGGGQAPLVDGVVYDEAGQITDTFTLSTSKMVVALDTAELAASGIDLPQFGSIEWTLRSNRQGFVTWSMNASGKFSVGMLGSCLD